jgi:cell division protein FtsI (penicillin-binding protein 3)
MSAHLRNRLTFLLGLLVTVASVLMLRLVYVQVVRGADLSALATEERTGSLVLPEPPRGTIYDRDGLPLTANEPRYAIEANPPHVQDVPLAAERLAPILHLPSRVISEALGSDELWVSLEPFATTQEGEAVQQLGLPGISARLRWIRRYPQGTLAADVLGIVSRAGEGFYGVEGRYNRLLCPVQQEWEGETGPSGLWPLPQEEGTVPPPRAGTDLVLTLDAGVQVVVEQELARALQEFGAESGTILVMDPRSGAILALASLPSFDPNRYERYVYLGQEEIFLSPAFGAQYEPGSVFKIITAAAALDSGVVTSSSVYVDTGQIEVGGRVYTNWDGQAYGEQDLPGLLGHSLNVGATGLAVRMGSDTFYRYVRAFGFGQPTGVDLQGEVGGRVRVPDDLDWHDSDLGANAFGQGVAVTPLQMISAVAAVANEGRLMRPYVVARQIQCDGTEVESRPVVRGQPISPQTARALSEILAQAVERHMPQVQVPGYRVAGKTGTAQIPVPGGYDPRWTIASFVGFGPLPDPQLIILVRLDRPQTSSWGSETAAPVFARLASRLFPMLEIPPEGGGP